MGILAWSETIFACSMYPVYQDFLDNVAAEVEQNVRRLNRHPRSVGMT
jgi:beta-mannosidase